MTAVAIEVLASALPDHDITLTPRPDGKFLLTVAKGGTTQLCRAVDRRTVIDPVSYTHLTLPTILLV